MDALATAAAPGESHEEFVARIADMKEQHQQRKRREDEEKQQQAEREGGDDGGDPSSAVLPVSSPNRFRASSVHRPVVKDDEDTDAFYNDEA